MTDEQLVELARLLSDLAALEAGLPEHERKRYREAQESVIRARREAGREGRKVWL